VPRPRGGRFVRWRSPGAGGRLRRPMCSA
jgi:hypothetical protein